MLRGYTNCFWFALLDFLGPNGHTVQFISIVYMVYLLPVIFLTPIFQY